MPLPLKRTLKAAAGPADRLYVAAWRARNGGKEPIPPLTLRSRVGAGQSIEFYVRTGEGVASKLTQAFRESGRPLDASRVVLDWGCGAGRVSGPLLRTQPGLRLSGCDVDSEAIDWASRHLSAADFRVNAFSPPLPYAAGSLDAVYSVSILTHLTHEMQTLWLEELHRVIRPNGLAVLTVCGPTLLRTMQSPRPATNSAEFMARLRTARLAEDDGFVFVPYVRSRWNEPDFPGIGEDYGLTFQTEAQVRRDWSSLFAVDRVLTGFINHGQDLVIATRRP